MKLNQACMTTKWWTSSFYLRGVENVDIVTLTNSLRYGIMPLEIFKFELFGFCLSTHFLTEAVIRNPKIARNHLPLDAAHDCRNVPPTWCFILLAITPTGFSSSTNSVFVLPKIVVW